MNSSSSSKSPFTIQKDRSWAKASVGDVSRLLGLLEPIYPLSEELKTEAYSSMLACKLKKDAVLLNEGDRCDYVYFIISGALMAYSDHNGKRITSYISVEKEFVSSISGLHGLRPSKESIIAIEPTSLIVVHNEVLQQMFEKYFELNYIFRVFMEEYYRDAQDRAHIIRLGDVKERYLYLTQTKPGFIGRLPLEHIASFLDMKPNTLSRIIKQFEVRSTKDEQSERELNRLCAYMMEKEAYKSKTISLGSLATAIGTSPHKLSSLINNYYKLNFVDFVNSYRVDFIKEQMAVEGNLRNYTIEALAYNAGFASRSSFYKAFKKIVGLSPAVYLQVQE